MYTLGKDATPLKGLMRVKVKRLPRAGSKSYAGSIILSFFEAFEERCKSVGIFSRSFLNQSFNKILAHEMADDPMIQNT